MIKPGRPKGTAKNGMKYLNDEQLRSFFLAVRKPKVRRRKEPMRDARDDLMFTLIFYFGLRVSELCKIELKNIYFPSYQIRIEANKNGRNRTYDMSGELWKKLKRWLKYHDKKNPFLFPHKEKPTSSITKDAVKRLFKLYARQAGIPKDFGVHSLRHSCAIQRAKSGDSPYRVMLWLRHKTIRSTEIYFDQIKFEDDDKRAKEVFEDYL